MNDRDVKLAGRTDSRRPHVRLWLPLVLKWALLLLVLFFVGRYAYQIWTAEQLDRDAFERINFGWLLLAATAYVVGCLPSVWFWHRLMRSLGARPPMAAVVRAYYCGHLGKYAPGKLLVLIIRATLLKPAGVRPSLAALTAAFETLLLMASGFGVAVMLLPRMLNAEQAASLPDWLGWLSRIGEVSSVVVLVVLLLCSPLLSRLLTLVALRMTPSEVREPGENFFIPARLVAAGLAAFLVNWGMFGLSLGCTIRSFTAAPAGISDWLVWTGAVSLATSVGFLAVFVPGGLGVREGLLLMVLSRQPGLDGRVAVVAALLLRLIWLAAEVVTAAVLYRAVRPDAPAAAGSETGS